MSKKAKPDYNSLPFDVNLTPGESILWMHHRLVTVTTVYASLILMPLPVFLFAVFSKPPAGEWMNTIDMALKVSIATLVVTLPVALIMFLISRLTGIQWKKGILVNQAFAITPHRLLFYNGKRVKSLPLRQIRSVDIIAKCTDGTGTLSFGTDFPPFKNVPVVDEVYHLILEQQQGLRKL